MFVFLFVNICSFLVPRCLWSGQSSTNHQTNYNWFKEPFIVSQSEFVHTWHMHDLIFEKSVWLLAGSTKQHVLSVIGTAKQPSNPAPIGTRWGRASIRKPSIWRRFLGSRIAYEKGTRLEPRAFRIHSICKPWWVLSDWSRQTVSVAMLRGSARTDFTCWSSASRSRRTMVKYISLSGVPYEYKVLHGQLVDTAPRQLQSSVEIHEGTIQLSLRMTISCAIINNLT